MENRKKLALGLFSILLVTTAPVANAVPITLETLFNAINDARDAILSKLGMIETKVDNIENKLDHLDLQVAVDLGYCGTGGIQCGAAVLGSGHTFEGAASTNHNPIRIAVLVTLHGSEVLGLADSDITFSNFFVPAGGGGAVEFNCGDVDGFGDDDCFQTVVGGLYVEFLHRGPAGNWKAGHYFATVTVINSPGAGETGTALIDWEIADPAAPNALQVQAIGEEAFADPGEGPVFAPDNNALILVRVTLNGEGVAGLTEANFDIATRLGPPGECELEIDEFNFFATHFVGDYAFKVTPIDTFAACDWAAGSYDSSIEVTVDGMKASTLVRITVT